MQLASQQFGIQVGNCKSHTCESVRRISIMATSSSAYHKLLTVGTKIIAVGRNYAAHAKELGNAVPKVFLSQILF